MPVSIFKRRTQGCVAAILALTCAVAHADEIPSRQGSDRARQIIEGFGEQGRLSFDGLRGYLNARAFQVLDADASGTLDSDEYVPALAVRASACGQPADVVERWQEDKQKAGERFDAAALYNVNPIWKQHIDLMTTAHWQRATGRRSPDGSLDLEGVQRYLDAERARASAVPGARERYRRFEEETARRPAPPGSRQGSFSEDAGRTVLTAERFAVADADGSEQIAWLEFVRAFDYPTRQQEFCALAGADFQVSLDELRTGRQGTAPGLDRRLNNWLDEKLRILGIPDRPAAYTLEALVRQERAARRAAEDVSQHGFVPGYGYLVSGEREPRDDAIQYNIDRRAVFLRVIKDFTIDDPVEAEPALFAVSKESGKDAAFTVDTTIQLDIRPPISSGLGGIGFSRLSTGIDVERYTAAADERNQQQFYATLDWYRPVRSAGILKSHYFRLSPFIDNDAIGETTRLAGQILWQPGLQAGRFATSAWLGPGAPVQWYVTPRAVLELAAPLRSPEDEGETGVDATHARIEVLSGLEIGGKFAATFKAFQRWGLGNDLGHSDYQEVGARWDFDEFKRFSLKSFYAWGKRTPLAPSRRAFAAGLGVKL